MGIIEAIVLGLVQGLTEFIPVSSSGHLEIVEHILNPARGADFHLFLEFINFGTLIALLIYYRHRIAKICGDVFKRHDFDMLIKLLLTSIPAELIGLLLSNFIESQPFFSSLYTIAIAMGVVGILMIFADQLPRLSKVRDEKALSKPRALLIGLAQTFALIPGVSRSGSTILAGRMVGMDNEHAANYSFLASIPIMLAVCGKSLLSSTSRAYMADNALMLIISNVVAFVAGMLALKLVMKYFKKPESLQTFGYYRVILACLVLAFLLIIQ